MGICGSASADGDRVGNTHTVGGSANPSDVTVDVNDNDETVVYADTVRLVSTHMLRRLLAAVTGDSAFDQLAVMSSGKDVTGAYLVAVDAWSAYYRAVWDCKSADADAKGNGGDAAARFGALLNAVENGAPYKKPGPSIASQSAALAQLSTALAAQNALLDGAHAQAETDAEFAPHKEQLALWLKAFGVFDGGLKLLDNIERITAS